MTDSKKATWKDIAKLAAVEKNPERLLFLTQELARLFDEEELEKENKTISETFRVA